MSKTTQRNKRSSEDTEERDFAQLVEQETLIFDTTETICRLLDEANITRQELATRLGKSKGFVTQLLSGERNMTLRTLSDLAFALEHRFKLQAAPRAVAQARPLRRRLHVFSPAGQAHQGRMSSGFNRQAIEKYAESLWGHEARFLPRERKQSAKQGKASKKSSDESSSATGTPKQPLAA